MKTAKKLFTLLLALSLLGAMLTVFSACGDNSSSSPAFDLHDKDYGSQKPLGDNDEDEDEDENEESVYSAKSPEELFKHYVDALNARDVEKVVNLICPPMLEAYCDKNNMDKDDFVDEMEDTLDEIFDYLDDENGKGWSLGYNEDDLYSEEYVYGEEDFEEMKELYKDCYGIEISDYRLVDVYYTLERADGEEGELGELSGDADLYCVEYKGMWYLADELF